MEKAKAAIKDLTARAGHHDTTVHEHVNPAVQNETVTPTRHEEAQTVVDREVHQDHHHTTVQPIKDREVLPEQHSHNLVGTTHKEYKHGDEGRTKERLAETAAQFGDTTNTASTKHTSSVAPTVGGEHVHHHVHETIQPVVQKETVQPSVVHTTVPVHEVHHNESKHHATSALPAVSMAEFKQQGGVLGGREDRVDRFEGEPRNETATQHGHHGGSHHHGFDGTSTGTGTTSTGTGLATGSTNNGPHSSNIANKTDPRVDSDRDGRAATGPHTSGMANKADPRVDYDRDGSRTVGGTGGHSTTTGAGTGTTGTGLGSTGTGAGTTGAGLGSTGATGTGLGHSNAASANTTNQSTTGSTKPSLMDKLNPKVDSNGDGQAGFMK